jgi:hypothetical protein
MCIERRQSKIILLLGLQDILKVRPLANCLVKDERFVQVRGLAGAQVVVIIELSDFGRNFPNFPSLQAVVFLVLENGTVLLLELP